VQGHIEVKGRTFYLVRCVLRIPDRSPLEWDAPRRLLDLREQLHGPVKDSLDKVYKWHFGGAPFAPRGGLPGTTSRLQCWLCALADCINKNQAPPKLVALVLNFLQAPDPEVALQQAIVNDEEIQVHVEVDPAEILDRCLVDYFEFLLDRFSSLEEVFQALEPDGREMVLYSNFVYRMQELGYKTDPTVVWNKLEPDGNGEIDFSHFKAICEGEMERLKEWLNLASDEPEESDAESASIEISRRDIE